MMMDTCRKAGIPEPNIEEVAGGIQITFLKDIFSEDYLKRRGMNERQIEAVAYVKKNGSINNLVYQQINDIGKTTATEDLQMLVEKGIFKQTGCKERGTKYELRYLAGLAGN